MQLKSLSRFSIIILTAMSLLSSCVKDDTGDVDVPIDYRDKYIGSWKCQETSQQFGNTIYTITIAKSNDDPSAILLYNFYQLGATMATKATVNISGNANSLTIGTQVVSGTTMTGTGSYDGTRINFSYTASDGQINDNVTAVCTRTN